MEGLSEITVIFLLPSETVTVLPTRQKMVFWQQH
jgi:hypothetical protein